MMDSLLNSSTLTQTLEQALQKTYSYLTAFATAEDFTAKMTQSFGNRFDTEVAEKLAQDWAKGNFTALPSITIRSAVEINGAMGAFAKATNTIYLSREYLAQNAGNSEIVASVLLEEAGHYIDACVNDVETPGDEGAIFSALVRGKNLSEQELQQLRDEDDSATIVLDGQILVIEQANFTGTNGNDTLPASGSDNTGDDTFDPRLGYDSVNGGAGTDLLIVNYASAGRSGNGISSYVYNNGNGYIYAYNGSTYDQVNFSSIEQFNVIGTNFDDTLAGGVLSDTLVGGGGNDSINGGAGNNILDGGQGNDKLVASIGNDSLNGGEGNDTISGGGGIDTIDGGAGIDVLSDADFSTATTDLVFDDTGITQAAIALANGISVAGIELFDGLKTGLGNDQIRFTQRRNNTVHTGSGNDAIDAGLGNDTVDGGAGTDVLIVNYASAGSTGNGISSYVYNNGSGYIYTYNGSTYDQVNFSSIEQFNVIGTNFDDTLAGGV
ncbi:MAG TPA: calcium-binding protein, partial [Coleofasciculaceae cyanobacterium]